MPTLTILGNLVRDPELRYTTNGTAVAQPDRRREPPPQEHRRRLGGRRAHLLAGHRLGRPRRARSPSPSPPAPGSSSSAAPPPTCGPPPKATAPGRPQRRLELIAEEVAPSLRWATATITKLDAPRRGRPGRGRTTVLRLTSRAPTRGPGRHPRAGNQPVAIPAPAVQTLALIPALLRGQVAHRPPTNHPLKLAIARRTPHPPGHHILTNRSRHRASTDCVPGAPRAAPQRRREPAERWSDRSSIFFRRGDGVVIVPPASASPRTAQPLAQRGSSVGESLLLSHRSPLGSPPLVCGAGVPGASAMPPCPNPGAAAGRALRTRAPPPRQARRPGPIDDPRVNVR